MKNHTLFAFLGSIFLGIIGCNTIPPNAVAVSPFNKEKYLGKWYEIARFDFRFEKDLINTTAEYSLNPNGSIKVINRGYNPLVKEWKEAIGKAKFVNADTTAMLKVSFFGPFYAGYNVIDIDNDYNYALIAGASLDYLWILSRQKTIPDSVKTKFLATAKSVGYNTDKLLWVKQE